ncbi:hypothetical protein DSECCO2_169790 [anaerobic digester metagenome]
MNSLNNRGMKQNLKKKIILLGVGVSRCLSVGKTNMRVGYHPPIAQRVRMPKSSSTPKYHQQLQCH